MAESEYGWDEWAKEAKISAEAKKKLEPLEVDWVKIDTGHLKLIAVAFNNSEIPFILTDSKKVMTKDNLKPLGEWREIQIKLDKDGNGLEDLSMCDNGHLFGYSNTVKYEKNAFYYYSKTDEKFYNFLLS